MSGKWSRMIRRASGGHTAAATAGAAPPPQFSATGSSSFPSSSPHATAAGSSASPPPPHNAPTSDHHPPEEKTHSLPTRSVHHYYHQPLWDRDTAPAPGVAALLSKHTKRHYPPGHPLFTAGHTSVDHLDPLYTSPTAVAPHTTFPPQKGVPISPSPANAAAHDSGTKGDGTIRGEASSAPPPPPLPPPNATRRATTTERPASSHAPTPSPPAPPAAPAVTMPSTTPVVSPPPPPPPPPPEEPMATYYPILLPPPLSPRPILAGREGRKEEDRRGRRRSSHRTWWNAPEYSATQPYGMSAAPSPLPLPTAEGMGGRRAVGHDGRTSDPLALSSMRYHERYPTGFGGRDPTVLGGPPRGSASSPEDLRLPRRTTTVPSGGVAPSRPTGEGTLPPTRPTLPLTQTFAMRPSRLPSRLLPPSSLHASAAHGLPQLHRSRSRFSRTPYQPPPPPPSLHYRGIPFASYTNNRYNPPRLPFASTTTRATFDSLPLSAPSGPPSPPPSTSTTTARRYPLTPDAAPLSSSPAARYRGGGGGTAALPAGHVPPPLASSSFADPVGGPAALGWAPSFPYAVRNARDATQHYYATGSLRPPAAPASPSPPVPPTSTATRATAQDGMGESVIPTVPLSPSFLHDWGMSVAPHQQLLALRSRPVSYQQYTGGPPPW